MNQSQRKEKEMKVYLSVVFGVHCVRVVRFTSRCFWHFILIDIG
jgi:hypothetical protein